MFRNVLILALSATSAVPAVAQPMTPGHDAARAVGESVFHTLDLDHSGGVTQEEMLILGDTMFRSMDADASDDISRAEMMTWDDGLAEMAAFRGRAQAHEATMGMVFDMFDADGDAGLTMQEHRDALVRSREIADADGDGQLSAAEFRQGFIMSVALRNALEVSN